MVRAALAKLDIDEAELAAAPRFTDILEEAKGGLPEVLRAMRFSANPHITAFLKAHDEAHDADRALLPWEAFALAAKVDIPQLLGATILALRSVNAELVKVIAITNHPDTVKARIKNARKPSGVKDRNALDTALRFLPAAKGPTIIALPNAAFGAVGGGGENSELPEGDDDADPDFVFPSLTETQILLTSAKD